MLWVLQNNLYNEKKYGDLLDFLERAGLPKLFVKAIPFTDRLMPADFDPTTVQDISAIPDIQMPEGPTIVMGSYTLAKIADKRGWKPGAFLEGLSYDVWSERWGDEILNPRAKLSKFSEVKIAETKFIRPVEDSKAFAGKVFAPNEWADWQSDVLKACCDTDPLNGDTDVLISEPVEIWTENRIWMVGGKAVTHSQYKRGRTVHYDPNVDDEVLDFAARVTDAWRPNDAYVIDVAQTPLGCKVVEVNCLNAAGFYAADMGKLVTALEEKFG
jgi:hypothetical protein